MNGKWKPRKKIRRKPTLKSSACISVSFYKLRRDKKDNKQSYQQKQNKKKIESNNHKELTIYDSCLENIKKYCYTHLKT